MTVDIPSARALCEAATATIAYISPITVCLDFNGGGGSILFLDKRSELNGSLHFDDGRDAAKAAQALSERIEEVVSAAIEQHAPLRTLLPDALDEIERLRATLHRLRSELADVWARNLIDEVLK